MDAMDRNIWRSLVAKGLNGLYYKNKKLTFTIRLLRNFFIKYYLKAKKYLKTRKSIERQKKNNTKKKKKKKISCVCF